jgi:hypothetical protein
MQMFLLVLSVGYYTKKRTAPALGTACFIHRTCGSVRWDYFFTSLRTALCEQKVRSV